MLQLSTNVEGLLKKCQSHQGLRPLQKGMFIQYRQNISTASMIDMMSPHQEQEKNHIIEKMRKKYHRKNKETYIKKTQLGEDQLTFTPEEYQQLQIIDECKQRGLPYCPPLPAISSDSEPMSAVDKLKKMGKVEDVLQQIRNNIQWGEPLKNQQVNYLFKKQKGGFRKRKQASNISVKFSKQKKTEQLQNKNSLNKYYHTLLNKVTFGKKKFLSSETMWSKHSKAELSFGQKLEIIKDQANRNVAHMCGNRSQYMTEQRKSAIYQCQILRLSKKILQSYQYDKLHFSVAEKKCQESKKQDEAQIERKSEQLNCLAEEVLQKNYNRIRAERRRVIQKLLC